MNTFWNLNVKLQFVVGFFFLAPVSQLASVRPWRRFTLDSAVGVTNGAAGVAGTHVLAAKLSYFLCCARLENRFSRDAVTKTLDCV